MGWLRQIVTNDRLRRELPFLALAWAALASTYWPLHHSEGWASTSALVLTLVLTAGTVVLRLAGRAHRLEFLVPLTYILVVALLRQAEGGSQSGLSALGLVPVVWTALYARRAELVVMLSGLTLMVIVPILVFGEPLYPAQEWRRALLLVAVGSMIGFVIQHLVADVTDRSEAMARQTRMVEVIATTMRQLPNDSDIRGRLCEAAVEVGGGDMAWLFEPDGDGHLVQKGRAGDVDLHTVQVVIDPRVSGAARVFLEREPLFVEDAARHPGESQKLAALTGAASVLFQPIVRGDEARGVLVVVWRSMVSVDEHAHVAIGLLATEIGAALERADLLAEVQRLADTDALTQLRNRRRFSIDLDRELSRAHRSEEPLCLAFLDLDHFKKFNDTFGHPAGDGLLRSAALAWSGTLRATDALARYGGEEFALLLPGSTLDAAATVLDRLRSVTPEGATLSAGLAQAEVNETADGLMARADEALYEAKRRGRDRVVRAPRGGSFRVVANA